MLSKHQKSARCALHCRLPRPGSPMIAAGPRHAPARISLIRQYICCLGICDAVAPLPLSPFSLLILFLETTRVVPPGTAVRFRQPMSTNPALVVGLLAVLRRLLFGLGVPLGGALDGKRGDRGDDPAPRPGDDAMLGFRLNYRTPPSAGGKQGPPAHHAGDLIGLARGVIASLRCVADPGPCYSTVPILRSPVVPRSD